MAASIVKSVGCSISGPLIQNTLLHTVEKFCRLNVISFEHKAMPLFHYTHANAVHSILQNQKLWLTDIRFLNDSQELHDGIGRLSDALKTPMPGLFENHDYSTKAIEYLRDAFGDTVSYGIDSEPIFVFSFARIGNLLSQWRAYGNYAIEFDEDLLQEFIPKLSPCIYDPKLKSGSAITAVTKAITAISQDMGRNDGCTGVESIDSLGDLVALAATFKHEGFSEEQEVRIIARAEEGDDSIAYTPKGNKLIPYLEVPISLDCIKAIHVGPMSEQDLAYRSMSAFVRKVEKAWQEDSANIEYWLRVEQSSIPYREK